MGNFGNVKGAVLVKFCWNFSNSYVHGDEKYDRLAGVWEDPGVH